MNASPPLIYTDGAARGNPGEAGAGFCILNDEQVLSEQGVYLGRTTNNVAEYMGVILALFEAGQLGLRRIALHSDSELLVKQLNGLYRVRDKKLQVLYNEVRRQLAGFDDYSISHVRREHNKIADRLANEGIDLKQRFSRYQTALGILSGIR